MLGSYSTIEAHESTRVDEWTLTATLTCPTAEPVAVPAPAPLLPLASACRALTWYVGAAALPMLICGPPVAGSVRLTVGGAQASVEVIVIPGMIADPDATLPTLPPVPEGIVQTPPFDTIGVLDVCAFPLRSAGWV